ncbi:MAG: hypothetical protein EBQ94_02040 [Flavobacteriales bacterium]|nr:hypothetical protein [Flavobacteriales bacterium]
MAGLVIGSIPIAAAAELGCAAAVAGLGTVGRWPAAGAGGRPGARLPPARAVPASKEPSPHGLASGQPDRRASCGAAAVDSLPSMGWPAAVAAAPAAATGVALGARGYRPGPSGLAAVCCGRAWEGPGFGCAAVAIAGCWGADPGNAGLQGAHHRCLTTAASP